METPRPPQTGRGPAPVVGVERRAVRVEDLVRWNARHHCTSVKGRCLFFVNKDWAQFVP